MFITIPILIKTTLLICFHIIAVLKQSKSVTLCSFKAKQAPEIFLHTVKLSAESLLTHGTKINLD